MTLILARVASLGIDAFVLACTELSFAVDANMYEDIPIFDSLNCMAREMMTASCPDKLEPLLEGLFCRVLRVLTFSSKGFRMGSCPPQT